MSKTIGAVPVVNTDGSTFTQFAPPNIAFAPASEGYVSWLNADLIPGFARTGLRLTTIAQSAGTASGFTGTGTLKTGANGINGHNA